MSRERKKEYVFTITKTLEEEHTIHAESLEKAEEIFFSGEYLLKSLKSAIKNNRKACIVDETIDSWECISHPDGIDYDSEYYNG